MTLDDWATVPAVAYRLTDEDVKPAIGRAIVEKWTSPLYGIVAILNVLLGAANIERHGLASVGPLQIAVGLLFVVQFAFVVNPGLLRFKPLKSERSVRFSGRGITVGTDRRERTVSWRSVSSVQDVDGILLFRLAVFGSIIVPKRVYADGGQKLWCILEDQLIAKRALRRRTQLSTIVNTAMRAS